MDGEFFDRIDIRREDFICRARSYVCSFSTIPWKQGRRNERRHDERRENDEKWTVTRIPFSRSDTYTLYVRARESADENRHVSFLAPPPFSPFSSTSSSSSSTALRPDLFCYFIRMYTAKTFTAVVVDPSDATGRGTLDNGIIDQPRPTNNEV